MTRLQITPAGEQTDVEVDLWGVLFKRVPVTDQRRRRATELFAEALQAAARADKDSENLDPLADDFVERSVALTDRADKERLDLIAAVYDLTLTPTAGGKKKASTVVKQAYRDGRVDLDRLEEFVAEITSAGRPT
jgi:hypothetical protein